MPTRVTREIAFELNGKMSSSFTPTFQKAAGWLQRVQKSIGAVTKAEKLESLEAKQLREAMLKVTKAQQLVLVSGTEEEKQALKLARSELVMAQTMERLAKGTQQVEKEKGGFGSTLSHWTRGLIGMAVAYVGIHDLWGYLKDGMEMAEKSEMAMFSFETVMKRVPGTTKEQIEAVKKQNAVLSSQQFIRGGVLLAEEKQLAIMQLHAGSINKMVPLLNDYLHATNGVSITSDQAVSAAKMFGKALNGSTGALRKAGIFLSSQDASTKKLHDSTMKAALAQIAYTKSHGEREKKALKTAKAELSIAKAQAIMAKQSAKNIEYLLKTGTEEQKVSKLAELMTKRFGGVSKEMKNTPTAIVEKLHISLDKMQKSIGEKLLPLQLKFLTMLNDHLPEIEQLFGRIATVLGTIFVIAGRIFNYFEKNWNWLKNVIVGVGIAIIAVKVSMATMIAIKAINDGIAAFRELKTAIFGVQLAEDAAAKSAVTMGEAEATAAGAGASGAGAGAAASGAGLLSKLGALAKMIPAAGVAWEFSQAMKPQQDRMLANIAKNPTGLNPTEKLVQQHVFQMLHIPAHAAGGLVTKPHIALVGEKGPELITPLNRLGNMGGTINVHFAPQITISGAGDVAEQIVTALRRYEQDFERRLQAALDQRDRVAYGTR